MRSKILCCFFIVPGDSYRPIPIERSEMKIRFGTLLMRVYGHNISIKFICACLSCQVVR
ncbi:hypothetical protein LINPERPRIM_LOCUS5473 [Linum perenne]